MKSLFILPLFSLLLSQTAFADPDLGEKLFKSTSLGTNGKSCQTCHLGGKGLQATKDFDSDMLQGFINICIEDALKGKPLVDNAQELQHIEDYIRQISAE